MRRKKYGLRSGVNLDVSGEAGGIDWFGLVKMVTLIVYEMECLKNIEFQGSF